MVLAPLRHFSPVAVLLLACLLLPGCRKEEPSAAGPADAEPAGPPLFEGMTACTGISFTYRNGEGANHYTMLETLGGGVAVLDYDGDGLPDLFFTGGGDFTGPDRKHISGYPSKLYRNKGGWRFEDVTARVGLGEPVFYTHGAAVADYDRDGWPDLLVTGWQRLALYHNVPVDARDPKKGRRFVEVSKGAGLPEGLWTTSAAFGDIDGDGFPDLYLCQYVDWSFKKTFPCHYDNPAVRDICAPKLFTGLPHKLYLNDRKGGFRDVSKSAGIRGPRSSSDYDELTGLSPAARELLRERESETEGTYGKGMGVLLVDVNGDGRPDLYVANDGVDKFLYLNRTKAVGQPLFEEKGVETGTARDGFGHPNASMGLAAADIDGSGRPSLFVTNFENEYHGLYLNEIRPGVEFFEFATVSAGLGVLGQQDVSWGAAFADFNLDGWEDLVYVSGHPERFPEKVPRAQRPALFHNQGGHFHNVRDQGSPYFRAQHLARGLALADLDNDGLVDVVVSHVNEPVVLLRNVADTEGKHWLGVELRGKDNRDVVGAKIVLEVGGRKLTRFAVGGGSFLSSNDPRHVFGLGENTRVGTLTVTWPSGKEQSWKGLAIDRYHRLTENSSQLSVLSSQRRRRRTDN